MRRQERTRVASAAWRFALAPALLIAAALPAQADWRQLAPQKQTLLRPYSYVPGANGSLWSLSYDGVRLTLADGTTRVVLRHDFLPYFEGQLLPDGSVMLRSQCQLQRLDAQGRRSWSLQAGLFQECADLAPHADGTFWLSRGDPLLAYDAQGKQQVLVESDDSDLRFNTLATLANGDVVAARNSRLGYAVQSAMLVRYDRRGVPAWSWSSAEPALLHHVTRSSDGDILAELRNADPTHTALQRWSAGGQLLWTLPLPAQNPHVLDILPAADGEAYVFTGFIASSAGLNQVLRVTRDGRIRWQQPGGCINFTTSQLVAEDSDGFALLCADERGVRLRRWRADGETGAAVELGSGAYSPSLYRLDADTLLALGDGRADGSGEPPPRLSLRIGRDGAVTPHALGSYQQPASTELIGQHLATDGSSYIAAQRSDSRSDGYGLTGYAADGSRLWTLARPQAQYVFNDMPIAAAAGKVCFAERNDAVSAAFASELVCLNSSDGSLAWSAALAPGSAVCALRVLDDGRVVSVVSAPDGNNTQAPRRFSVQTRDANGQSLADTDSIACFAAIDANGRTTVASARSVAQYEADGRRNYLVAREPGADLRNYALASGDDGSAWLVERQEGQPSRIRALRPDGSTRWLVPGMDLDSFFGRSVITAAGDAVYLLQRNDSAIERGTRLQRLDAASGAQRWTHDSSNLNLNPRQAAQFAVSADGSSVVLAHAWPDRLRLEQLDVQYGQLKHERFVAIQDNMVAQQGGVHALALDASGTARVAMNLLDDSAGLSAGLLSIDHIGSAATPIRLDQPGIGGAWWAPYAHGEGIVLDWFAQQRTLFGAWFTYTTTGGNDAAQLRWYTIQAGNVAANATSVQLPILETTGGSFDAGPPASPAPVGTAMLSFTDCDNATLTYAFNAGHNDGVTGAISLSRLTPAIGSCILADGTTRPGAGAKPPQAGFDARMSGSWYEEATSGQGLQFTVQPGGVFFAPWFTYDPEGQGNDTNREHWFTLQGNLANAANGKAEVVIAQSLGGAFDRIPTYNGFAVGKATVTMTACDKARVDYRFDDSELAGSFRKRSGTLELSKIGGCSP